MNMDPKLECCRCGVDISETEGHLCRSCRQDDIDYVARRSVPVATDPLETLKRLDAELPKAMTSGVAWHLSDDLETLRNLIPAVIAELERLRKERDNAVMRANSASRLFDTMRNALRKLHDFSGRALSGDLPEEKP